MVNRFLTNQEANVMPICLELLANSPIISIVAHGLHLSQRMALQQVLAPQLQQSLALLQAPMLELKTMVEQELQQNPVLEEISATEVSLAEKRELDGEAPPDQTDPAEPPADTKFDPATEKTTTAPVDDFQAEFEKLAQMDQK